MTSATRPKRAPRGGYAKGEATKQAILQAATEVLGESGYRSGSLRQIAARVGISEPGIFHHFPSKAALLEEVLDARQGRYMQLVKGPDAASTIRGVVKLAAELPRTPGLVELNCVLSAEALAPDHPAHSFFMAQRTEGRSLVEDAFRQLKAEGRFKRDVSSSFAAYVVASAFDGAQIQWLVARDKVDMAEVMQDVLQQFVDIDWDIG